MAEPYEVGRTGSFSITLPGGVPDTPEMPPDGTPPIPPDGNGVQGMIQDVNYKFLSKGDEVEVTARVFNDFAEGKRFTLSILANGVEVESDYVNVYLGYLGAGKSTSVILSSNFDPMWDTDSLGNSWKLVLRTVDGNVVDTWSSSSNYAEEKDDAAVASETGFFDERND